MRLTSLTEPFDHPDWIFELKYDGFRALAHIGPDGVRLTSRNGNIYKSFRKLEITLGEELRGRRAVLDGELVFLDEAGKPQFYTLLKHRSDVSFYAFDLLELEGRNLRELPLLERKSLLRKVITPECRRLLYAGHIDGCGRNLFSEVCRQDLEGIVAKWKHGAYVTGDEQPIDRRLQLHATTPERAARLTWIKIKNPDYSQAVGRDELFQKRASA